MARIKQEEIDLGNEPGVTPPRIKELDRLGDKFISIRDDKAELAKKLTKVQADIAEKMIEHRLEKYHYSDREVTFKKGKTRIEIKQVHTDGVESNANNE